MINNVVIKVIIGLFFISIIFFVIFIMFFVLIFFWILVEEILSGMFVIEVYIFLFGFEFGYFNYVVNCFIYFYSDCCFRKEV